MKKLLFLACLVVSFSCVRESQQEETKQPVLVSLLGKAYYQPERSPESQARLDSNLRVAKENFDREPSEDNYIWLGRRQGYLMHLQEAVQAFTDGLIKYPDSYRLLRHRGHRYISLREFDNAIADLHRASELMAGKPTEIEPDGQPNAINRPLSNTQFNVWYHLALAHYLNGDFPEAEEAYLRCMDVSDNDDLVTATADWLYMTYRRQGKQAEAAELLSRISDSMNIVENDSYFLRLRMYQGILPPDSLLAVGAGNPDPELAIATQGYGVGNWYFYSGDTTRAIAVFNKVLDGRHFTAFGFIASEVEVARLKK